MKEFKIVIIFLCCISLFIAKSVFAEGNIKMGAVEVHPRVSIAEEYESNIFWKPSDEKEDWMTILTPGIRFDLPFNGKRHLFSLDYYADIVWFNEFSSQDYQNHYVTGLLDFNFPEWTFDIKDRFLPQTSDRADTEFTERVKRKDNRFTGLFGKEFSKFGLELGYENYWIDYSDSDLRGLDRMDNIGTVTGYVQILPKTKALLEYNYADISYDIDDLRSDGDYNQIRVGLRGSPTEKMTLIGKVGYQMRDYDSSGEPDWNHAAAYLDLVERFTERLQLHLNYALTAEESTYSINNFYQRNRIDGGIRYRIFRKFTVYPGAFYAVHDYPETTTEGDQTKEREDDLWGASVGVRYDIKDWLFADLNYTYAERDSNLDVWGYKDNTVLLRVTGEF